MKFMNSSKPILLVDDDLVDVMTIERASKELKIGNEFVRAANGEEALAYLRNPDNESPCIILLDLNMPRMNGHEFLLHVKSDDDLRRIPVVVLTTSREEEDRQKSFQMGVAGYMVKPADYQQFLKLMRTIDAYWTWSELPD